MHRSVAAYAAPGSDESALIKRHASLIDRQARRLVQRTGMSSAYDDLWSAGALGLIEAHRRFDAGKGASFETFAEHRVRGAMLDELRRLDHLPRRMRARTDELNKARRDLGTRLGREPTTEEIATELDVDLEDVVGREALSEPLLPLESALGDLVSERAADDDMVRQETLRALTLAIDALPQRLQMLLSLHYVEGLTYREIAHLLEVSEPRVCQLHGDALAKLRAALRPPEEP